MLSECRTRHNAETHIGFSGSTNLQVQDIVAQDCALQELSGVAVLELKKLRQIMPPYSPPTQLQLSRRQELNTNIEQRQGTRAAVRRMKTEFEELGQRSNLPLPPELLGMIFDFYVHLYRQLPEKLLFVCRTWHVLALSQPTLWTKLDPRGQFGLFVVRPWAGTFLQSRIARSKPVPLKVDFTSLSLDMTPEVVKKVVAIPTFRSRIQELIISRADDLDFLVGDQPLLRSLTIRGNDPLERLITSPKQFNLAEKKIIALRLDSSPKLPIWPDSLLQRLQTLEVTLSHEPQVQSEFWAIIQKSNTLRTLHITLTYGSPPVLSHPSVQRLSIAYPYSWDDSQSHSLEELRLPHLQELTIHTWAPKPLMNLKLVETPVLSLRLICKPRWSYGDIDPAVDSSWVDGVVCLLRSTFRLKRMEISAPSSLVSGVLQTVEKDGSLCPELNALIVNGPTGTGTVKGDDKRNLEAKFDQLRDKVATFMDERQSSMSIY